MYGALCNSRGSGNAIVPSVCFAELHFTLNCTKNIDSCTIMLQWQIFAAGKNKTYVIILVKCTLLHRIKRTIVCS